MKSKQLDLLIVADSVEGGLGAAACSHARWFSAHGWSVALAAPGVDGAGLASAEAIEVGVPGAAFDALAMLRAAKDLRRVISLRRPVIVHAHGTRSELLVLMAGRRPVVTMHGGGGRVAGQGRASTFARRTARYLAPLPARRAYSAAPVGGRWHTQLLASPRLQSLNTQPVQAMASVPTFLWVGRMDHPKEPETFVRAVAVLARRQTVRGVLLGDGPLLADLKEIAAAERIPVEFMGERADLEVFLASAWAVCLFSGFEGIPFAVQEAMWAARSTILTPLPSLRWFAAESAMYAANVEEAAQAMGDLSRRDVAEQRGLAAAARVRQLISVDDPFTDLLREYEQLRP